MDFETIIAEFRQERYEFDVAILSLERLASRTGQRRGRPPAWMTEIPDKRRGRPPGNKNKATPKSVSTPNPA